GDADQRRRPGELLEVPPGPRERRRRLGQLRAPLRARRREERRGRDGAQLRHLGSADARTDESLGGVHAWLRESMGATLSTRPSKDRKSTRLNSSHVAISYAVFRLKKKRTNRRPSIRRAPTH